MRDRAGEIRRGEGVRVFVALYPPEEVAREMVGLVKGMGVGDYRAVRVGQVHMTVLFVGTVGKRDVDDVVESVERSASGIGGFMLTPQRLVTLPRRGRARLVAVETDAPSGLLELRRRLVHRLARHVRTDANDRFLPHFTVCRFAKGAKVRRLEESVEMAGFEVDRVRVMRSVLRSDGAVHDEIAGVGLG